MSKNFFSLKPTRAKGGMLIAIFFTAMFVLILFFLLNGTTKTSGRYPENTTSSSLSCTKTGMLYPFFTYDNATRKEIKINAIFGQETLSTISLIAHLYYPSADQITGSEAHNHAAMNKSFGAALGPDALGASYAKLTDAMKMSLFAKQSDVNAESARFFLINTDGDFPQTLADYRQNYEKQGFSCEIVE